MFCIAGVLAVQNATSRTVVALPIIAALRMHPLPVYEVARPAVPYQAILLRHVLPLGPWEVIGLSSIGSFVWTDRPTVHNKRYAHWKTASARDCNISKACNTRRSIAW